MQIAAVIFPSNINFFPHQYISADEKQTNEYEQWWLFLTLPQD